MKAWLTGLVPALLVVFTLEIAVAKLPAAPPMDPAKAEEKKAKDAAVAATVAAQQAKAEDRAAGRYIMQQKAKGKLVTPQMAANSADMEAKAKAAAAKVPAAQPAPAVVQTAASPAGMKK